MHVRLRVCTLAARAKQTKTGSAARVRACVRELAKIPAACVCAGVRARPQGQRCRRRELLPPSRGSAQAGQGGACPGGHGDTPRSSHGEGIPPQKAEAAS